MPPLLPPEPTPTPEPSSDLDIALIAGSAAGGLVLLLLVVGAALFCVWKGALGDEYRSCTTTIKILGG